MAKIVVVDFAGTLIKPEIIEEANAFRSKILERGLPSKEEHGQPDKLYKINREYVEKLTGLRSDMKIRYRENDLDFLELSAELTENQISTNLFQIGMYMAAKKHGKDIIPEGLLEQLERIQGLGYTLVIVSGVRTDIISGVLHIAGIDLEFEIYGQPPVLGRSNAADYKMIGKIAFILGDKIMDFADARAQKIHVQWGYTAGGEEEAADYSIKDPKELENIIT